MKVLVVSPHFDDAPLSLGQSMVDGELSSHRVRVGIVFSRSNWTRWFHPTAGRAVPVTLLRLGEELWNSLRFRYRLRLGGLSEAVLRTGDLSTDAILDRGFDPTTVPELARTRECLRGWARHHDVVVAPLGLGDHVDHRIVAAAAVDLLDEGVAVAFYEDRPYAAGLDDETIAAAAKAVDGRLERRVVSGPMGPAKHGRIWYPSQFDDYFTKAIAADEAAGRCEHVWVLPDSPWPQRVA